MNACNHLGQSIFKNSHTDLPIEDTHQEGTKHPWLLKKVALWHFGFVLNKDIMPRRRVTLLRHQRHSFWALSHLFIRSVYFRVHAHHNNWDLNISSSSLRWQETNRNWVEDHGSWFELVLSTMNILHAPINLNHYRQYLWHSKPQAAILADIRLMPEQHMDHIRFLSC